MSENILELKNLKTHFFTKHGEVPAVDGVDITVPKGKIIGIVGESGCGKSVTATSIMHLIEKPGRIVDGQVLFDGEDITYASAKEINKIRGDRMTMIFQEPMTSLNPVYTVGKQVSEAIILHQHVSKEEAKQMTIDIFEQVGIPEPEKRFKSYPHQLSGGLRQRVMIGMAMVCKPDLMIADEPTTALDVTIEAQILHLMREMQQKSGASIIMITHNLGVVAELCDEVYVMYAGKVMEHAEIHELFENPCHPYTYGLLNSIPDTQGTKERLYTIKGMVPNLLKLPQGCRFCPRCDKAMKICMTTQPELQTVADGHEVRCHLFDKEVMGK